MKPVQLEMVNFGPYQHLTLNFESLETSPLFLISGDTGAGKSTLFDAMTVALFYQTTNERKVEEMRSTFATLEDELTQVTLYFRHHDTLYKIERTIKQMRKSARGKGVTEHKPTAKLTIVDQIDGTELEFIAGKPVDVAQAIDELLQLNAAQFKQIMLLPQNDVQRFLHSKTEEKLPILKTIFGTQLFAEFTKQLEVRYKEEKHAAESLQQRLDERYDSPSWPEELQNTLSHTPTADKITIIKATIGEYEGKIQQAKTELKTAESTYKLADKEYQKAVILENDFENLAHVTSQYDVEIVGQHDYYTQLSEKLARYRLIQPLDAWQKEREILQVKLKESTKKRLHQQGVVDQVQIKWTEFSSRFDQLSTLKASLKKQQEKVSHFTEYSQLAAQIKAETTKLEVQHELCDRLTQEQTTLTDQLEQLETSKQELILQQAKLPNQEELTNQLAMITQSYTRLVALAKELQNEEEQINVCTQQLQHDRQKIEELEHKKQEYDAILQELESDRRALMIAQLQTELTLGEVCMVCGETVHHIHEVQADEKKLLDKMTAVDEIRRQLQDCIVELTQLNQQNEYTTKQREVHTSRYKEYELEQHTLYQQVATQCSVKTEQLEELAQEVTKKEQHLAEVQEKERNVAEQLATLTNEVDTLTRKQINIQQDDATGRAICQSIKTRIEELYKQATDLDTTQDYEVQTIEGQQEVLAIETTIAELEETHHTLSEEKMSHELMLNSFIEQEQMQQNELAEVESRIESYTLEHQLSFTQEELSVLFEEGLAHESWTKFIHAYEEKSRYLSSEIERLKTRLVDQTKPNLIEKEREKDEKYALQQTQAAHVTKLVYTVEQMNELTQSIEAILEKQGIKGQQFNELSELYQVIKGVKGSKLKLETYVIQEYLMQVLEYANQRYIRQLTKGRYEFLLNTSQENGRRDTGLDIDIFDFATGTIRSTKTLSGGETFIAALSIALSLSDVVQNTTNGAMIDALFIDEGFGSLDKDTLEQAMEALEKIGENRMVGVISHVEEMKERIGQQLIIKKLGNGSSRLSIREIK